MVDKQNLWVGVGCQRGISQELIHTAIKQVFEEYQLIYTHIAGIATIDKKASEIALLEFCQLEKFIFKTFSPQLLNNVFIPNPNHNITKLMGTPSIAEASAIVAARETTSQEIKLSQLLVPKQILRLPETAVSVTIAVAKSVEKS
ncbi:cobalamin biosynthesis protein [Cuspidothrix issatschenkoi LEGE 03284]|uniref:cobalamin biosynthesis protein n=1 Tax=Cuspidothrix issatschenkoi TaxID=230752 RepID=UPI00187DE217|nr:cobalamin biosynthesis protein [Cuspidothrix issatschenkoi]MBE9233234.1 cobalamin biosynthesis protein [Cuspidothrix issatschenkoi LEGE 03284]